MIKYNATLFKFSIFIKEYANFDIPKLYIAICIISTSVVNSKEFLFPSVS